MNVVRSIWSAWRRRPATWLASAALLSWAWTAQAQTLRVSGSPATLRITTAVAGSQPTAVSDASTTYRITNNRRNQKITGQVNQPLPAGVTLTITLGAPAGATSLGAVPLGTAPRNLVSGINRLRGPSTLPITYQLSATVAAGVVAPTSRLVTLTILTGP